MERKRKLPARAAARAEQLAKRRNPSTRSRTKTPTPPPPPPEPVIEEPTPTPPPAPLPTSVEPGKPLPTIEVAQPHDLSPEDYQSISERFVRVMAENTTANSFSRRLLTCFLPQRRAGRVTRTITTAMDQRRLVREVLDETAQEKGRPHRGSKEPPERFHDQNRQCYNYHRTTHCGGDHVRCQRTQAKTCAPRKDAAEAASTATRSTCNPVRPCQRRYATAGTTAHRCKSDE